MPKTGLPGSINGSKTNPGKAKNLLPQRQNLLSFLGKIIIYWVEQGCDFVTKKPKTSIGLINSLIHSKTLSYHSFLISVSGKKQQKLRIDLQGFVRVDFVLSKTAPIAIITVRWWLPITQPIKPVPRPSCADFFPREWSGFGSRSCLIIGLYIWIGILAKIDLV